MNIGARWPTNAGRSVLRCRPDQLYEARRDPLVMIGGSEERAFTKKLKVLTEVSVHRPVR